jgi:type I restriction enzyme, S subunit
MNCTERTRIGAIMHLERRVVQVDPSHDYQEIGIRSFGRGIFHKEPTSGVRLGSKRVFWIEPGDLLLNNVFAWEGAIAVADEKQRGLIGSHRFMTYVVDRDRTCAHYLLYYFLSDVGLEAIRGASPGSAGRNRTLGIEAFESLEIPLPPIAMQREIAANLEKILSRIKDVEERLTHRAPSSLLALLPSLTQATFESCCSDRQPVAALADFVTDTVHPGEDPGKADVFIGLQHIESHSGRLLGSTPLGDEKGRKFRFQPGDVVYGYLRPYLNKVWVADRHGLCSVDQYVLRPKRNVGAGLLAHALRCRSTLDEAIRLTHSLQLPRLRSSLLSAIEIPACVKRSADLEDQLDDATRRIGQLVDRRDHQMKIVAALETAALNRAFTSLEQ